MQENSFKYDIVIVGLQPWDVNLGSNCVDIAKAFSKRCRVLYVNRPSDIRTELKKWISTPLLNLHSNKRKPFKLTEVHNNLWVLDTGLILDSVNFLKGKLFRFFLKRNCKKIANSIKIALSDLGISKYILFNDNDFFQGQYLREELSPKLYLYYLRDYLIGQPYFKRNGKAMEEAIFRKADFVFTNSHYLRNYALRYNQSTHYIGQGCNLDLDLLNKTTHRPKDLVGFTQPIVGYVGNIVTIRLDLDLLERAASSRKDVIWLFVGPLDKGFRKSKLTTLANVIFTGHKTQQELPHYINSFDVCINPQLLNDTTIGNYPRKIDEYMLLGKPIVARKTDFTKELGDLIYQYENEAEFLQMLDNALSEESSSSKVQERKRIALSHTWDASVNKIFETLDMIPS